MANLAYEACQYLKKYPVIDLLNHANRTNPFQNVLDEAIPAASRSLLTEGTTFRPVGKALKEANGPTVASHVDLEQIAMDGDTSLQGALRPTPMLPQDVYPYRGLDKQYSYLDWHAIARLPDSRRPNYPLTVMLEYFRILAADAAGKNSSVLECLLPQRYFWRMNPTEFTAEKLGEAASLGSRNRCRTARSQFRLNVLYAYAKLAFLKLPSDTQATLVNAINESCKPKSSVSFASFFGRDLGNENDDPWSTVRRYASEFVKSDNFSKWFSSQPWPTLRDEPLEGIRGRKPRVDENASDEDAEPPGIVVENANDAKGGVEPGKKIERMSSPAWIAALLHGNIDDRSGSKLKDDKESDPARKPYGCKFIKETGRWIEPFCVDDRRLERIRNATDKRPQVAKSSADEGSWIQFNYFAKGSDFHTRGNLEPSWAQAHLGAFCAFLDGLAAGRYSVTQISGSGS